MKDGSPVIWLPRLLESFDKEFDMSGIGNYSVVPGGLPSIQNRPIQNVWSAAVLQAKNEDDRIGLRECIRP